ncbi:hypothetical protein ACFQZE_12410 [Paenibacillus sp. GCM10027627]|uniref:hypothetical protein n=1 Tax=unclassified Paenibacillus TaxID=185978 RepID=UPI0036434BF7
MKGGSAPLAAFVGTTPNIGTTTAAYAAALRIAEHSKAQVGFLCLHLKSAKLHRFIGVDEPAISLDGLQPELRSAALSAEMLRSACYTVPQQPNLRVLFGNLNREGAEFVGPEEIGHLLDVAAAAFSFVVVDVGAYWDNAATVCSLQRADSRILLTTAALSHFQEDGHRWISGVSPLFNILPSQYDCIVIQNQWGRGGYSVREICKELGVKPLGEFHLKETMFNALDKGNYSHWLKHDPDGKEAMKKTAMRLMERHGAVPSFPAISKQPWYRKLMTHRNGVSSS